MQEQVASRVHSHRDSGNMLVILVVVMAVISEYAGVLGPMVGASRRYDGPMGKSDRAFCFGVIGAGVATGLLPALWINLLLGLILALLRKRTRPVASADYWQKPGVRSFLINKVFNGVLVDRERKEGSNPLQAMLDALDGGDSLIIFPEGTRNLGDEPLLPFKSGLYHLAQARPDVELVPVWIANLNRVMPKGRALPLPLLCTLSFGAALECIEGEGKEAFLERARNALLALAPEEV